MTKLRSTVEFQDYLDHSFAWRLKEVADMRASITDVEVTARKALLRASVALLYAHWEGFIKEASLALVNFVSNQRLTYRELKPCFVVLGAKKNLQKIRESGNPIENIAVVEFFLNEMDKRADISSDSAISADSNLRSDVFTRIVHSIGVDISPYETKFTLIDTSLVDRRNSIAHGEYLDVEAQDFIQLSGEILAVMRMFKTDLQNISTMKSYKI